jgi:hypothetical protein
MLPTCCRYSVIMRLISSGGSLFGSGRSKRSKGVAEICPIVWVFFVQGESFRPELGTVEPGRDPTDDAFVEGNVLFPKGPRMGKASSIFRGII